MHPMIYLDHNATTPILPEVLQAMMPYLTTEWGNPSSSYGFGSKLKGVIEKARRQVAELIGASPREVVFTSCATESNNTAIRAALAASPDKRHIVTSAVEHSSVLTCCKALETQGYQVTYLPVDSEGLLDARDLEAAIRPDTALISLMWANNETGVMFPVEAIAAMCRERHVLYHCDAVQAAGKIAIDATKSADYLSITGHKLGAPKGVGALYVGRKAPFSPLMFGGHQERGRRGGTEAVPLVVAMGAAAEIALGRLPSAQKRIRALRDMLETSILHMAANVSINGHREMRLANTSSVTFNGVTSESLLLLLDHRGICASSGSACLADTDEPSHVLVAMKGQTARRETIRFSLGENNTEEEINLAANHIAEAVGLLLG